MNFRLKTKKNKDKMGIAITYHNDNGSRKGCHRVTLSTDGGRSESLVFLVDEPGAWWDDEWNCHVDGVDYPCKTREHAICKGLHVLGYLITEE